MAGTLYLVSTPIGNLDDITIRAKKILSEVDLILAEDTKKTGRMLIKFGPRKGRLISFYQENEEKRVPKVIDWLGQGKTLALVSNAGTPLLSDPGYKLVREVINQGFQVIPVPGASALLSALIASGFSSNHFVFLGFLPKRDGRKERLLREVMGINRKLIPTVVFYEAPTRVIKSLEIIKNLFGNIPVVIAQEITKIHERFIRGNIDKILLELKEEKKIKGELTVVFYLGR